MGAIRVGDTVQFWQPPRAEKVGVKCLMPAFAAPNRCAIPIAEAHLMEVSRAKILRAAGFEIPEFCVEGRRPDVTEIEAMRRDGWQINTVRKYNIIREAKLIKGRVARIRRTGRVEIEWSDGDKFLTEVRRIDRIEKVEDQYVVKDLEQQQELFFVGAEVKWFTSGRGSDKQGKIVAVIPPGEHPDTREEIIGFKKKWTSKNVRNHESYIVLVHDEKDGRKKVYWPNVKSLEVV